MARLPPGNPDSQASATIASSGGGDPPKRPNHNKGGSGMGHYNERYRVGKTYKSTDRLTTLNAKTALCEITPKRWPGAFNKRQITQKQKLHAFEHKFAIKTPRCRRHGPPSIHPDRRHTISAIRLVNSNSLTNPKFRNNIRQP
ncbi:hypothetical protein DIS24_g4325 [Lasiodiplodia hormozganensis]|uniref:Uncharacterized protein n=1 Tax=Lasiodiplodia hormozganensis TaxID=869390 RepID=A0AA39YUL5_9PEZI|nr:hypothetical protein DIS24_g4325 [Lasiodiplodia hormozganensis]